MLKQAFNWNWRLLVLVAAITVSISSCKIYKFTGASTGAAKTIRIGNFPNLAPILVGSLSGVFVDNLEDKVANGTNLTISNEGNVDLVLTGSITNYYVNPVTISGTETTEQNRLTISIQADFVNTLEPDQSFTQTFSDGENYDANQSLTDVQDQLIDVITNRIAQSIFNKAFVNW